MKVSISGILALLLITTVSKLFYFYLYFDLNIFNLLDADEILMNIIYTLPFTALFFIGTIILYQKTKHLNNQSRFLTRAYRFERELLFILLFFISLGFIAIIGCYIRKESVPEYQLVISVLTYQTIFLLIIAAVLGMYIIFRLTNDGNGYFAPLCTKGSTIIFCIGISIVSVTGSFTLTEIVRAKKNVLYVNAKFEGKDGNIIKCTSSLVCIGITKKFVILFDNVNEKPIILNISEIKAFETKYSLNSN